MYLLLAVFSANLKEAQNSTERPSQGLHNQALIAKWSAGPYQVSQYCQQMLHGMGGSRSCCALQALIIQNSPLHQRACTPNVNIDIHIYMYIQIYILVRISYRHNIYKVLGIAVA